MLTKSISLSLASACCSVLALSCIAPKPVSVSAVSNSNNSGIVSYGQFEDGSYGNTITKITDIGDLPPDSVNLEDWSFSLDFYLVDSAHTSSRVILNNLVFKYVSFRNNLGQIKWRWIAYTVDALYSVDDGASPGDLLYAWNNSVLSSWGFSLPIRDDMVSQTVTDAHGNTTEYLALTWDYSTVLGNDLLTAVFAYPFTIHGNTYFPEFLNIDSFAQNSSPSQSELNDAYDRGKQAGKEEGRKEGIEQGKLIGREEGAQSVTTGAFIGGLFAAIAEVPITILNGVGAFSFFNVSILSILLIFLFMGVVVWLIKKLI